MKTSDLVSDAIHKRLRAAAPTAASNRALNEAYDKVNGAYRLVDKAIRMFYNPTAINFAQAGSEAAGKAIYGNHEDMMALGHYLLAGDFFDRHQDYIDFLDTLQDPKLFKKYKHFVIERPTFQNSTCNASRATVFHQLLKEGANGTNGNGRAKSGSKKKAAKKTAAKKKTAKKASSAVARPQEGRAPQEGQEKRVRAPQVNGVARS